MVGNLLALGAALSFALYLCSGTPLRAQGAPSGSASASGGDASALAGLAQYVGQYRSTTDPDEVTVVYLDGGALYEESEKRQRQRMIPDPSATDRFKIESPPVQIEFQRAASGAVSGLKFVMEGGADTNSRTLAEETRFGLAATR